MHHCQRNHTSSKVTAARATAARRGAAGILRRQPCRKPAQTRFADGASSAELPAIGPPGRRRRPDPAPGSRGMYTDEDHLVAARLRQSGRAASAARANNPEYSFHSNDHNSHPHRNEITARDQLRPAVGLLRGPGPVAEGPDAGRGRAAGCAARRGVGSRGAARRGAGGVAPGPRGAAAGGGGVRGAGPRGGRYRGRAPPAGGHLGRSACCVRRACPRCPSGAPCPP